MVVKHSDYVGFSGDNTVLMFTDYSGSKLEMCIKLRLREYITLYDFNITGEGSKLLDRCQRSDKYPYRQGSGRGRRNSFVWLHWKFL